MNMKKSKYLLLLLQLCFVLCLYAQQKGVSPLSSNNHQLTTNHTYAVVVGISDYQDRGIPDLRFADKDAEAFANFLRSPFGGNNALANDRIKVLRNQEATAGNVAAALDGLLEKVKEGDRVIIYFSGHGDVERKTVSQPGFLLCWDAPSKVYMGGGTYSLAYLQEIVTTLSTVNLAKVIVISDACHAGKLAGSQIGGAQLTTSNLAKQFSNEIKILACQPGEFSLEGEQWGGGRGCFSYHLINGLAGLADINKDLMVTLGEIDRYLEDHVVNEVAPQSQVPIALGNKMEKLVKLSGNWQAEFKNLKDSFKSNSGWGSNGEKMGWGSEDLDPQEQIVFEFNENLRTKYMAFTKAIKDKIFFEPKENCAETYFNELISLKEFEPLQNLMKLKYVAALQDDAQQTLNKYMGAEIGEISLSFKTKVEKYKAFPKQLARAAELLGVNHYLYKDLKARQAYFEGFPFAYGGDYSKTSMDKALSYFHEALNWQTDMPLALLGIQYCYGYFYLQADSAEVYAHKANQAAPAWVLPYVRMAEMYSDGLGQYEKAEEFIELAEKIDSGSAFLLEAKAEYYFHKKDYFEAEQMLNKLISIQENPTCLPCSKDLLVQIYVATGRMVEAEKLAKKLVEEDPSHSTFYMTLGKIYVYLGRREEANKTFEKVAQLNSLYSNPDAIYFYLMAFADSVEGQIDKSFESLEKALKAGMDDYAWMQQDPDMELLRKKKEKWDELMKQYFPEKEEKK